MSSEVEVKPSSPTGEGDLVHDSEEYESAEEIEGDEYEEEIEVEVEEEEEEGEAGEEAKDKPLDDDEDRKNPQFIPKKGYFYEHDDRMHGEGEEEVTEPPAPKKEEKPKKENKVITDRWSHDLYDENEQTPKSQPELEDRYGYDIRGDDMAPRARRKRLYGRGPTKYTRKWEEEEAYQRPRGGFRGRRAVSRGRDFHQPARRGSKGYDEDFPQLSEEKDSKKYIDEQLDEKNNTPRTTDKPRGRRTSSNVAPTRQRRSEWDDRDRGEDNEDRSYGRGGRGSRGRGGRRNEFSNRNRYPDRRGSGQPESNNSASRPKAREERDWAERVDRMREQDEAKKQPNGTSTVNFTKSFDSPSSSKSSGYSNAVKPQEAKKSTLPFTNTEYTGSASLTAQRNQDPQQNYQIDSQHARNRDDKEDKGHRAASNQNYGTGRNQVSMKVQQQPAESAKPKRFSSQKPKQDSQVTSVGTIGNSATHVSAQTLTTQTAASQSTQPQVVPKTSVPVSVISGYPQPPHSQTYYEQVAVSMPTNYESQNYEASGSPITVPISAYSTSPYPSPPTGPPPVQPGFDPSAYIAAPQPQIFAPPPHPHPQFISDPTIINYVPPGPPPNYGLPFHSQGYQGYPQVSPGPPELYHGGVTYYSPQNQLQRPHIMVPTKRPKSVLQLVEPPKPDMRQGPRPHLTPQEESLLMSDLYLHQYREESVPHVVDYMNMGSSHSIQKQREGVASRSNIEQQLSKKFEESVSLQPKTERVKKSPSPAPLDLTESKSWADQMADITPVTSPADKSTEVSSSSAGSETPKK